MASTTPSATASEPAPRIVHVGTRNSKLALRQAETVVAALEQANPGVRFVIDARETAGDRDKTTPLPILGKGLWTSEFEARLVAGDLDLVVHSAKDMPTTLPAGCLFGATLPREDPRDVVVFAPDHARPSASTTLADLPVGSIVGTSSVRRAAQLRRRYPHLAFQDLRGNIDTRLRKLDTPEAFAPASGGAPVRYDCIVLAAAGLKRMGLDGRIAHYLDAATSGTLYAVGQGALGLEVRADDADTLALLQRVTHTPTMLACLAERAVMRTLEGGCSVPIGVETTWGGDDGDNNDKSDRKRPLRLQATVVSLDGQTGVDADVTAVVTTAEEAEALGLRAAQDLIDRGAQSILDEINKTRLPVGAPVGAPA
ncbi:porphobilinogen deaminase [Niveomyces insectorum RCEF 264]|uniref:Porphobilinogen deaminase n=1 Tax=Niveomyces insectorum RCEF 264 TaxID=1081102 RepID=A0A167QVR1_9HYPO|nr:porphobilinogen deaminase [Niveomyces insectorum RCEF 264]